VTLDPAPSSARSADAVLLVPVFCGRSDPSVGGVLDGFTP
jgi:hypothetical protein